jgi:hypothetical protein
MAEAKIGRAFVIAAAIVLAFGCERPTIGPETIGMERVEQVLVLSGFNPADTVIVGPEGYRVGLYHDFSPYDTLDIAFSALHLDSERLPAHLMIRVGPASYFRDTLDSPQKDVMIRVICADLPKPQFSALSFFSADPDTRILLAHLRVIGWRSVAY